MLAIANHTIIRFLRLPLGKPIPLGGHPRTCSTIEQTGLLTPGPFVFQRPPLPPTGGFVGTIAVHFFNRDGNASFAVRML